jgi:hypothetical protein
MKCSAKAIIFCLQKVLIHGNSITGGRKTTLNMPQEIIQCALPFEKVLKKYRNHTSKMYAHGTKGPKQG